MITDSAPSAPEASPDDDSLLEDLVLDRIDALQVLRAETPEEQGALLEQLAGSGEAAQAIVREMGTTASLAWPDRFEEAHRLAMRSVEVLARNGARPAKLPAIGPLKPIAAFLVGLMTRWIVRGHQNALVRAIRELYERREASTIWGSPAHGMLRRARMAAARIEPGYKGSPLGLPTFLVGGAVLSSVFTAAQAFLQWTFAGALGIVILGLLLTATFAGLAWAALYSAGVARRRIRLSTDQPMQALWETVGACGKPPKDASFSFALYAIMLLMLMWILVPALAGLLFTRL